MGLLALSDFEDELEVTFGERNLSAGTLARWINFGYLELCTAVDFEGLDAEDTFNTAVGDDDYTAPTDPLVIKIVRNMTQDEPLTWTPKEDFMRLEKGTNDTPKRWTRHIDDILVWPTPIAIESILVVYKDEPAALSAASDETVLPAAWDMAVTYLATGHGYMTLGEEARAIVWYNKAISYINSRMTEGNLASGTAGLLAAFNAGAVDGVPNSAQVPG